MSPPLPRIISKEVLDVVGHVHGSEPHRHPEFFDFLAGTQEVRSIFELLPFSERALCTTFSSELKLCDLTRPSTFCSTGSGLFRGLFGGSLGWLCLAALRLCLRFLFLIRLRFGAFSPKGLKCSYDPNWSINWRSEVFCGG